MHNGCKLLQMEDEMKRFWNDLKKHNGYGLYSAKAELKAEVAGSYLNWIWWILEPFCFMLIYTFIFGYVFNAKEAYFPVFIFIGITAWDFFSRWAVGHVHDSIVIANILLRQVFA